VAFDDADHAALLRRLITPYADYHAVGTAGVVFCQGSMLQYLGRLNSIESRWDAALIGDAFATFVRLGCPVRNWPPAHSFERSHALTATTSVLSKREFEIARLVANDASSYP
jgi:hypothetical protein